VRIWTSEKDVIAMEERYPTKLSSLAQPQRRSRIENFFSLRGGDLLFSELWNTISPAPQTQIFHAPNWSLLREG
jgi:hypothetical protein